MGFDPKKPNNKLKCPMKFSFPENGIDCDNMSCSWFMPIQRACAINCIARLEGLYKYKLECERK